MDCNVKTRFEFAKVIERSIDLLMPIGLLLISGIAIYLSDGDRLLALSLVGAGCTLWFVTLNLITKAVERLLLTSGE